MERLIEFGTTKMLVSLVLALLALIVQRSMKRPPITHVLWLMVIASMFVPSVVRFPARQMAELVSSANLIGSWWPVATAAQFSAEIRVKLTENAALILGLLWISGSVVLATWSLIRLMRFHQIMRRHNKSAAAEMQQLAATVARALQLKRVPHILTIDATISPMVWFAGSDVRVVVPAALSASLDTQAIRLILAHEFAHIRRRDHWVRWVEWFATIVFWWNPITWVARRHVRTAEELCCDSLVLSAHPAARRPYARALLAVVDFLSNNSTVRLPAFASTMASHAVQVDALSHRLRAIISDSRAALTPAWTRVSSCSAVLFALSLGLLRPIDAPQWQASIVTHASCDVLAGDATTWRKVGLASTGADAKALCDKLKLKSAKMRIGAAVASGAISAEQAQEKLAEIKRRLKSGAQ